MHNNVISLSKQGKMYNLDHVVDYLKEVTGFTPAILPFAQKELKKLPYLLRDFYKLDSVIMMGHQFTLAGLKTQSGLTPSQLAAHAELLRQNLGRDIAFSFNILPAYMRLRLVQHGVAFIIPGTHLFLPFLMMDFRTKTRQTGSRSIAEDAKLSMPAQLLLLYDLQHKPVTNRTLGMLAAEIGYSAMTLSRISSELSAHGFCEVKRYGMRKTLRFFAHAADLWNASLPSLQSPVIVEKAVQLEALNTTLFFKAGLTALAEYTMLADDTIPTFAIFISDWRNAVKNKKITEIPFPDETGARVEVWGYNPHLLAADTENSTVDRLSLYLSCKDHTDERVQGALQELMKGVQWLKD